VLTLVQQNLQKEGGFELEVRNKWFKNSVERGRISVVRVFMGPRFQEKRQNKNSEYGRLLLGRKKLKERKKKSRTHSTHA